MARTIVGLFDHISQARATVQDLADAGFKRDEISLIANASAQEYAKYFDDDGKYRTDIDYDDDLTSGEGAAAGAGIGATIGGIGGLLMGLGLLAVPGVGPALAAGPIISALVGAGIGAASGGLMGGLVNHGIDEEYAGYYAEGVRRGGSLVMLTVAEEQVADVERIMNANQPVDIDERVADWKDAGFTSYNPKAEPYTAEQIAAERDRMSPSNTTIRDIDSSVTGYDGDESLFRQHYDSNFVSSGRGYEYYGPAYRFGSRLLGEPAFSGMTWNDVETDAQRRWEERNPGTWNDYRDAVRYSYEQGIVNA